MLVCLTWQPAFDSYCCAQMNIKIKRAWPWIFACANNELNLPTLALLNTNKCLAHTISYCLNLRSVLCIFVACNHFIMICIIEYYKMPLQCYIWCKTLLKLKHSYFGNNGTGMANDKFFFTGGLYSCILFLAISQLFKYFLLFSACCKLLTGMLRSFLVKSVGIMPFEISCYLYTPFIKHGQDKACLCHLYFPIS